MEKNQKILKFHVSAVQPDIILQFSGKVAGKIHQPESMAGKRLK
jgi:hypothetical protein